MEAFSTEKIYNLMGKRFAFLGLSSAKVIISYFIATQFLFKEAIIEKEIKVNFFILILRVHTHFHSLKKWFSHQFININFFLLTNRKTVRH